MDFQARGWRWPPGVGWLGVVDMYRPRSIVHLVFNLILIRNLDDRIWATPFVGQFRGTLRGGSFGPDQIAYFVRIGALGGLRGVGPLSDPSHPLLHLVNIGGRGG